MVTPLIVSCRSSSSLKIVRTDGLGRQVRGLGGPPGRPCKALARQPLAFDSGAGGPEGPEKASGPSNPLRAKKNSLRRHKIERDNSLVTKLGDGLRGGSAAQQSLPWSRWRSTRPLTYRKRGVVGGFSV